MAVITINHGLVGGDAVDADNAGRPAGNGSYFDLFYFRTTGILGSDNDDVRQQFTTPNNQLWYIDNVYIATDDAIDNCYMYFYADQAFKSDMAFGSSNGAVNMSRGTSGAKSANNIITSATPAGLIPHDSGYLQQYILPAGADVVMSARINNVADWTAPGHYIYWELRVRRFFFDADRSAPILPYNEQGGFGMWPPAQQQ